MGLGDVETCLDFMLLVCMQIVAKRCIALEHEAARQMHFNAQHNDNGFLTNLKDNSKGVYP